MTDVRALADGTASVPILGDPDAPAPIAPFAADASPSLRAGIVGVLRTRETTVLREYDDLLRAATTETMGLGARMALADKAKAAIRAANAEARQGLARVDELYGRPARARIIDGVRLTSDEREDAAQLAQQHKDDKDRLSRVLEQAIEAGATRRIRVAARAMELLGAFDLGHSGGAAAEVLGTSEPRVAAYEATDPEVAEARRQLDMIDKAAEVLRLDDLGERALYVGDTSASVAARFGRGRLGIQPVNDLAVSVRSVVFP